MTRGHSTKRRHDKSAELPRSDDLDERLNRIVDRSAKEAAEKARLVLRKKECESNKSASCS